MQPLPGKNRPPQRSKGVKIALAILLAAAILAFPLFYNFGKDFGGWLAGLFV
jgi:hypothetical protein